MAALNAMVLGRVLWRRGPDGWRREPFSVAEVAALLAEVPGEPAFRLIYEPEGLGHQTVEVPRVNRSTFSSLERVRREFSVVESEVLGWGIEPPEPAAGGSYSTLLHFELTPALVRALGGAHSRPRSAAWSVFTVAEAGDRGRASSGRGRGMLFLLPDFVALAQWGGPKRSFKSWTIPLSDRDWKALSIGLGDGDEDGTPAKPDGASRRGPVTVVAEGGSEEACPFWARLRQSGRIEAVLDLDGLADRAAQIPIRHPGNLAEAFPRPLRLDRHLAGLSFVSAVVVVLMVLSGLAQERTYRQEEPRRAERLASLDLNLAALRRNQAEMAALQAEDLTGEVASPRDRAAALRSLAAAWPDPLTLTRLSLGPQEAFRLAATVNNPGFDAAGLADLVAGAGLVAAPKDGSTFDSAKGEVEIHGVLGGRQP